jgi:hypothetical protein
MSKGKGVVYYYESIYLFLRECPSSLESRDLDMMYPRIWPASAEFVGHNGLATLSVNAFDPHCVGSPNELAVSTD